MTTYIQLRNNVGFAVVQSNGELDHSVTPDHTTAIIVESENPDQFLKQKYDTEKKTWSPAPVFKVAEINEGGDIVEIRHTVFTHEIDEDTILMPEDITHMDKYVDGEWVKYQEVIKPPVIEMVEVDVPIYPELGLVATGLTMEEWQTSLRAAGKTTHYKAIMPKKDAEAHPHIKV